MGLGQGGQSNAGGGGHDFVRNPTSNPGGGGHDFVRDPKGTASGPVPRDFTKAMAPPQQSGQLPDTSADSVSPGGRYPLNDSPNTTGDVGCGSIGNSQKPFVLKGEGGGSGGGGEDVAGGGGEGE